MSVLAGKIAVVTGATSGIGKAIALILAKHGARLCLIGRNPKKLQEVARTIQEDGAEVSRYKADLGLDEDISVLIGRLRQDLQHIEILIHSAGAISLGSIEEAPVEDLDWQYRINVRAPFILTQALLPMLRSGKAHVVFINSTVGLVSRSGVGQYAATKQALKAMAETLRDEENASGLRVLSIFSGRTATPMQAEVHETEGRKYTPELLLQPEDVAQIVVDALCAPRTAEITEIKLRPASKLE